MDLNPARCTSAERRGKAFYVWKVWNGDGRGAMSSRRNNPGLCQAPCPPFRRFYFDSPSAGPLLFAFLRPRCFVVLKHQENSSPRSPPELQRHFHEEPLQRDARWNLGLNHREKHPQNSGVWLCRDLSQLREKWNCLAGSHGIGVERWKTPRDLSGPSRVLCLELVARVPGLCWVGFLFFF